MNSFVHTAAVFIS